MLNFRFIDKRFAISGGWTNLPEDVKLLHQVGIGAVLDLQFTPADQDSPVLTVAEALRSIGIEYSSIRMWDSSSIPQDLEDIFSASLDYLTNYDTLLPPDKKILVKCAGGISRSPAILCSYLCQIKRWKFEEGIDYIRRQDRELSTASDPNMMLRDFLKKAYGSIWDGKVINPRKPEWPTEVTSSKPNLPFLKPLSKKNSTRLRQQ